MIEEIDMIETGLGATVGKEIGTGTIAGKRNVIETKNTMTENIGRGAEVLISMAIRIGNAVVGKGIATAGIGTGSIDTEIGTGTKDSDH